MPCFRTCWKVYYNLLQLWITTFLICSCRIQLHDLRFYTVLALIFAFFHCLSLSLNNMSHLGFSFSRVIPSTDSIPFKSFPYFPFSKQKLFCCMKSEIWRKHLLMSQRLSQSLGSCHYLRFEFRVNMCTMPLYA